MNDRTFWLMMSAKAARTKYLWNLLQDKDARDGQKMQAADELGGVIKFFAELCDAMAENTE